MSTHTHTHKKPPQTPPQPLRPLHTQVIWKAYLLARASREARRNGRWGSGVSVNMEDVHRLKAVNGDCLCNTLDVDGVGLVAPVEDFV